MRRTRQQNSKFIENTGAAESRTVCSLPKGLKGGEGYDISINALFSGNRGAIRHFLYLILPWGLFAVQTQARLAGEGYRASGRAPEGYFRVLVNGEASM